MRKIEENRRKSKEIEGNLTRHCVADLKKKEIEIQLLESGERVAEQEG